MQNVLTHEAGHFFGLGHSDHPDATMFADAPIGQTSKRTLADDDRAGICAIYGDYAAPQCKDSDFTPNHGFSAKCDAPAVESNGGGSSSSGSGCAVRAIETGRSGIAAVAIVCLVMIQARRRRRYQRSFTRFAAVSVSTD